MLRNSFEFWFRIDYKKNKQNNWWWSALESTRNSPSFNPSRGLPAAVAGRRRIWRSKWKGWTWGGAILFQDFYSFPLIQTSGKEGERAGPAAVFCFFFTTFSLSMRIHPIFYLSCCRCELSVRWPVEDWSTLRVIFLYFRLALLPSVVDVIVAVPVFSLCTFTARPSLLSSFHFLNENREKRGNPWKGLISEL